MSHQLSDVFFETEPELLRFLTRRLKCVLTAQDMTHELFLKISAQGETSHIQNHKAYLFRMAANLATDHARVEQNRADILAEAHDVLWGGVDSRHPERVTMARQELARLEQALAQLPPLSRRIFHLNRYERKPQLDIAKELQISLSTVEKHIRKVLTHLAAVRDR
ncbi:MAG: RNA polymerase sigma factor [Nitrospira sp.]|nr:RNA polymerase sigma factor [Nitrospira sp.]